MKTSNVLMLISLILTSSLTFGAKQLGQIQNYSAGDKFVKEIREAIDKTRENGGTFEDIKELLKTFKQKLESAHLHSEKVFSEKEKALQSNVLSLSQEIENIKELIVKKTKEIEHLKAKLELSDLSINHYTLQQQHNLKTLEELTEKRKEESEKFEDYVEENQPKKENLREVLTDLSNVFGKVVGFELDDQDRNEIFAQTIAELNEHKDLDSQLPQDQHQIQAEMDAQLPQEENQLTQEQLETQLPQDQALTQQEIAAIYPQNREQAQLDSNLPQNQEQAQVWKERQLDVELPQGQEQFPRWRKDIQRPHYNLKKQPVMASFIETDRNTENVTINIVYPDDLTKITNVTIPESAQIGFSSMVDYLNSQYSAIKQGLNDNKEKEDKAVSKYQVLKDSIHKDNLMITEKLEQEKAVEAQIKAEIEEQTKAISEAEKQIAELEEKQKSFLEELKELQLKHEEEQNNRNKKKEVIESYIKEYLKKIAQKIFS